MGITGITNGAVCVYHAMVEDGGEGAGGSNIPVAAVSTGFPAGLTPLPLRIKGDRDVARAARTRSTSS